jgi:hypothetical protein
MIELIYGFYVIGSFSLGYSLLRTVFPQTQKQGVINKLIYGYLIGVMVVIPSAALTWFFQLGLTGFFLLSAGIYFAFLLLFWIKRKSFNEKDQIEWKKEKKKEEIPKRILKEDEQVKKSGKRMDFEHGLMVKTTGKEQTKQGTGSPKTVLQEKQKQVYKEKEDNIITALEKKTKEMEAKNREKEKKAALERLRDFAQEIKEKKKKSELEEAEQMDEIEEDLLNEMSKEEEY